MKKIIELITYIGLTCLCAACSASGLNPDPSPKQGQKINIRLHSGNIECKTGVSYDNGIFRPYWNHGDKISVVFDSFTGKSKMDATLANNTADKSESADFSTMDVVLNNGTTIGEDGMVYSFHPAAALQELIPDSKAVRINLPGIQKPAAVDSFDPAADILVGKPSEYIVVDGELYTEIDFARVMCVVKVNLKAGTDCPAGLEVNKLTFSAPAGTVLTGRAIMSLEGLSGSDNPLGSWSVRNNSVIALYDAGFRPAVGAASNTVYLIVNPTTIAAGGRISFELDTDDYTVTKNIDLPKDLVFKQGASATIGLTIDASNCVRKEEETRLLVESFNGTPASGAQQMTPAQTGVVGTGVSEALTYTYSTSNTNIRNNSSNGHGNSNPYLWISGSGEGMTFSGIAATGKPERLRFSCQSWTIQGGKQTLTLQYKSTSKQDWQTAGAFDVAMNVKDKVYALSFPVAPDADYIDIRIIGSAGYMVVDDIVLEEVDNSFIFEASEAFSISNSTASVELSFRNAPSTPTASGIQYGTSPLIYAHIYNSETPGSESNICTLRNLEANTTYYYRGFITIDGTTSYTEQLSFTTASAKLPSWLDSYELPSYSISTLTSSDVLYEGRYCHSAVNETYGTSKACIYNTTSTNQLLVVHTFESTTGNVASTYSMLYDKDMVCALWVAYVFDKTDHTYQNIGRKDGWCYDPAIPKDWQPNLSSAYKPDAYNQDYSRGHQCASNDRQTTISENKQTFYYSNMTPQNQPLNGGSWAQLESDVQNMGKGCEPNQALYVVTGPLFEGNYRITPDKDGKECPVPTGYYKCTLLCTFNSEGVMTAASGAGYTFVQDGTSSPRVKTSIDAIEARTGFDFFASVPDKFENAAEAMN